MSSTGQIPVVCYNIGIARKVHVQFQYLGKSSEANRPYYALYAAASASCSCFNNLLS